MRIFILEDSKSRIQKFKDKLNRTGISLFIATSANEAYHLFEEEKEFDIMFLDHDLGGKVFMESTNLNSGFQVAKYIKENDIKAKRIIIHSLNSVGAINMNNILPQAERINFFELMMLIKIDA